MDERHAFAIWLRGELTRRFEPTGDAPVEWLDLIEQACTRG
jgi:hypothetical protein